MNENEIQIKEFLDKLFLSYFKSITEISKTGEGNYFIINPFEMICLDDIAIDFAQKYLIDELLV